MITLHDWCVRMRFYLEDTHLMWQARCARWRLRGEHYQHLGRSRLALARFYLVCLVAEQPAAPLVLLFAAVWPVAWWLLTARP